MNIAHKLLESSGKVLERDMADVTASNLIDRNPLLPDVAGLDPKVPVCTCYYRLVGLSGDLRRSPP
eukprot:1367460-Amorphochlora_amoeboformis.AAC.1